MVIAYDFDSGRPSSNLEWGLFTKYIDGKASSIVVIIECKSQIFLTVIDLSLFNVTFRWIVVSVFPIFLCTDHFFVTFCQHSILSVLFCPYPFVRTNFSVPFCLLTFCQCNILSIPFCPHHFVRYHFVQCHFVHITYCPYHFVRTVLSATILS